MTDYTRERFKEAIQPLIHEYLIKINGGEHVIFEFIYDDIFSVKIESKVVGDKIETKIR